MYYFAEYTMSILTNDKNWHNILKLKNMIHTTYYLLLMSNYIANHVNVQMYVMISYISIESKYFALLFQLSVSDTYYSNKIKYEVQKRFMKRILFM